MKYTININQKAVIDNNFKELSLNHLAILDAIVEMINCKKFNSFIDESGEWFWIKTSKVLEQLPILDIKERRCKDLILDLQKYSLLESNPNNKEIQKCMLRIGSNYQKLVFFDVSNNLPTYAENCIAPMQNIAKDNNINNNNIFIKEENFDKNLSEEFLFKNWQNLKNLPMPDYLNNIEFILTWQSWCDENIQRKRKVLTKKGYELWFKKLAEYSELNSTIAIKILEKSISSGWQGIFKYEDKNGNNNYSKPINSGTQANNNLGQGNKPKLRFLG